VDLYLPAAAFSESDATRVDYAGRVTACHQAVPPPGEARSTWQILCTLAQAMGADGFDFAGVEAIRDEIATVVPGFAAGATLDRPAPAFSAAPGGPATLSREPRYLGFPLAAWVEGLRSLYPEETTHG
jgi:NADH dehydrogenase/NADH:ubiquinone oxidoreductase subunit G